MAWRAAAVTVLLASVIGALVAGGRPEGRAQSLALTWDFEAGSAGWQAGIGSLATGGMPRGGASALVFSPGAAAFGWVRTLPASIPVAPGAVLQAGAWVRSDGGLARARLELLIQDAQGRTVSTAASEDITPGASYVHLTAEVSDVLHRGQRAELRITIEESAAGASVEVDDVTLEQVGSVATATATATASATASSTSTASATATSTSTSTATSTATASSTATTTATATTTVTASPTPTKTATPTPTPSFFGALTNGDFEDTTPLYGWAHQGGEAYLSDGYVSADHVAVLHSTTTSTKWLHQAVLVEAGGWYEASAILGTQSTGDRAWLRLAWYASLDGTGSQLSVEDSEEVGGAAGSVLVGPVQAPPGAQSVRVRLMLRPASAEFAMLAADYVTLTRTAPPTPTPTRSPTPTRTPTLTPTPTATSTVVPPAPPASTPGASAIAGGPLLPTVEALAATPPVAGPPLAGYASKPASGRALGGARTLARDLEAVGWLRISEVFPNPPEEGVDAAFEWVELANVGPQTISLDGIELQDNAGSVLVPSVLLQPGATLVLGGPQADAGGAILVRLLADGISNGLGNGGDRLTLIADGRVLDALSYGSDRTYIDTQEPIGAPAAGASIRRLFADDGSLAGIEISSEPSPGRLEGVRFEAGTEATTPPTEEITVTTERETWLLLAGGAAALLLAAALWRMASIWRGAS
ncbi:MAG: lamin tail domain-containing protein [Dehalococcoidia bacterium]